MLLRSLILVGALVVPAVAMSTPVQAPTGHTLVISSTGKHYLLQEDATGNLSLNPIARVIRMDGTGPIGPITPPVVPETDLSKAVTEATQAIYDTQPEDPEDPTTAQALSLAYRKVAAALESGRLPASEAFSTVTQMTDEVLEFQTRRRFDAKARWAPWRTTIGQLLTKAQDDEDLDPEDGDSVAKFMRQIEAGLVNANKGMALGDRINWQRLFAILERILDRILDEVLDRIFAAQQGG